MLGNLVREGRRVWGHYCQKVEAEVLGWRWYLVG